MRQAHLVEDYNGQHKMRYRATASNARIKCPITMDGCVKCHHMSQTMDNAAPSPSSLAHTAYNTIHKRGKVGQLNLNLLPLSLSE